MRPDWHDRIVELLFRMIELRPVDLRDAATLFYWHNDTVTRAASRHPETLSYLEYLRWLDSAFLSPNRELHIALDGHLRVGLIRIDRDRDHTELSWQVAPGQRRKGYGHAIVRLAVEMLSPPLVAMIKPGNAASVRVAERAGFKRNGEHDGLWHYSLHSRPQHQRGLNGGR